MDVEMQDAVGADERHGPQSVPYRPLYFKGALIIARKESGELLFSKRGLLWLLVMSLLLSGFALLLVSDTELGLLDNAQVVYDMVGLAISLGALLSLVVGADAIGGEHERGSLVPLLLAPLRRSALLLGKLGGQLVAWAAMLGVALPYLWAVGSTGQNLAAGITCLIILGTPVVLAFGCLGVALGARLLSARSALTVGLVVLILSASPIMLGPGLRRTAIGVAFDWVNPFSAVLNAVDAVVIDSEPLLAQALPFAVALAWMLIALWYASRSVSRLTGSPP
jgi:ABC-type transport system involved in multi-copper enzyme maturation permease subunit